MWYGLVHPMIDIKQHPWDRRSFLKVGSLGLGGLSLDQALAAAAPGIDVTGKSVIFLFMHGGPSQTETFDPKMDQPDRIRSATGEIRTSIPGITFGSTFPELAKIAHKFTVVRSFQPGTGNHDIKPIVCKQSMNANLGSVYARVAGASDPQTGMPRNATLFPRAVEPKSQAANNKFGKFASTGELGVQYAPFSPSGGSQLKKDMELHISKERLGDRRHLLNRLDQLKREADQGGQIEGVDRFQQQAFSTLMSGMTEAFDIHQEDNRLIERYDTSHLINPKHISKAWNNYNNYVDHVQSLGKLLLLARRLAERGCKFITVTTNFVWDMHADKNNATMTEGMDYVGRPFDHAVSAFIEDIEARGLKDKILLVCCGEMGRTPKINGKGGRDHWGGSAPLLLYGGGLKSGHVVGASTKDGGEPAHNIVRIPNLYATIMDTVLDTGAIRLEAGIPKAVTQVISGASPIRELI